jgi:hypothetical protein
LVLVADDGVVEGKLSTSSCTTEDGEEGDGEEEGAAGACGRDEGELSGEDADSDADFENEEDADEVDYVEYSPSQCDGGWLDCLAKGWTGYVVGVVSAGGTP